MNFLDKWNKNKFNVYNSEEKTVLKLIAKIGDFIGELSNGVDGKTDLTGDHKGSWQGINKPTLSEEGMRGTVEKLDTDVVNLKQVTEINAGNIINIRKITDLLKDNFTINVKEYGAKGDGITDDTNAIITAISYLQSGYTLYFPSGTYIVHKDFEGVTTGNAKELSNCILIKDKHNIKIVGEGNTTIRPNNQYLGATKKRYPCILTLDKCSNIEISNLTIESKGQNFGDADFGVIASRGDDRTNFVIQNGGSAIFVCRSKNIVIDNVKARLTGSCAAIYHSNVSDCVVKNTFANAMSDGYAAFTTDEFVGITSEYTNSIIYDNCSCYKEDIIRNNVSIGNNKMSGKCGILTEGGTTPINVKIINCKIKDCTHNGTDTYLGSGIISYNSKCDIQNTLVENCNRFAFKRDLLALDGFINIANSKGVGLKHSAVVIKDLYSLSHTVNNVITNNSFEVTGSLVFTAGEPYLLVPGGIVFAENSQSTNKTIVTNNYIKSPRHAIYQLYRNDLEIMNNTLIGDERTVVVLGGGTLKVANNVIERLLYTVDTGSNLRIHTTGADDSKRTTQVNILNNTFIGVDKSATAIEILSDNPATYITELNMDNNIFSNCCYNYNMSHKIPLAKNIVVPIVSSTYSSTTSRTTIVLDFSNNQSSNQKFKVIDETGVIVGLNNKSIAITEGKLLVTYDTGGDKSTGFIIGSNYTLI